MTWFRPSYSLEEIDTMRQLIREIDYLKAMITNDFFKFDTHYPELVELRLRTYLEQGVPIAEFEDQKRELQVQMENSAGQGGVFCVT